MAHSRIGTFGTPEDAVRAGMPQDVYRKRVVIAYLVSIREDPTVQYFLELFVTMIDELRKENDRATVKRVIRNQGAIDKLSEIVELLTKYLPTIKNI